MLAFSSSEEEISGHVASLRMAVSGCFQIGRGLNPVNGLSIYDKQVIGSRFFNWIFLVFQIKLEGDIDWDFYANNIVWVGEKFNSVLYLKVNLIHTF